MTKSKEEIDDLRKFLGTLPARTTEDDWSEPAFVRGVRKLDVRLISPTDPQTAVRDAYKAMFTMATATWGDGNCDGNWGKKWENSSPAARYRVLWHVLHRQTLPTANEVLMLNFEVSGLPRHCFDQVARTRLGMGFGSIGCRDNSKLSSEFVLYSKLYDYLFSPDSPLSTEEKDDIIETFRGIKKSYKDILVNRGSYQIARAILPMSYHHQFVVRTNLLALFGMFMRRSCLGEEEFIVAYAWRIREIIEDELGMRMVASSMRPPCFRSKNCHYAGNIQGFGGLAFSLLFKPSDPVCQPFLPPDFPDYAEFNESCTSSKELIDNGIKYVEPGHFTDFPVDYSEAKELLHPFEVEVFEKG